MKAFVNAFGDKAKLEQVINTYAKPGVVPGEIKLCELNKPNIVKTEKKGNKTYYTLEATVKECDRSKNAEGTIRVFSVGWENNKLVDFIWKGPKSGKVEY